jgi:hypothetical protein
MGVGREEKRGDQMKERTYRQLFTQFLNDYWGAFHEVLEAQSVNPRLLAGSLFDKLVAEHRRLAALDAGVKAHMGMERLERLWAHVVERRTDTPDAPLSAKEIAHARTQFEEIYDDLVARGAPFGHVGTEVLSHALHGHPRGPSRVDAAR